MLENENPFHPVDLLFAEKLLSPFPDATEAASVFLAYMLAAAREGHLLCLLQPNQIVPSLARISHKHSCRAGQPVLPDVKDHLEGKVKLTFPRDGLKADSKTDVQICRTVCEKCVLGAEWDSKVLKGAQELPLPLLEEVIVRKGQRWYLRRNWECEARFLKHFNRLNESPPSITVSLEALEQKLKSHSLQPEQIDAIRKAATQSVTLICGGPGTGKTFTAAVLIKVLSELLKGDVVAAAPTGKAAANLRAILGHDIQVKTLQAFLKKERLLFDLLLVDEGSMIDAELMANLFASLKKGARLVLVGDTYQLPPVDSGNFFADLTHKKELVVELKRSLRTDRKEIVEVAAQIKASKPVVFSPLPEVKVLVNKIADRLCLEEGVEKNYDRFRVLSPLRQGPFGVDTLNQLLYREHLRRCKKKPLFVPIMIMANHHSLDLFNGETGFLVKEEKCAYFSKEKQVAEYLLPPYEYAYLLSVHKSQGSEYDSVWILLPEGSEVFGRQMLYTAVTRAKKEVEILSTESVMRDILVKQSRRLSGLFALKSDSNM